MTLQKTFLAPVLVAAATLVAIIGLSAFVHADTGTSITATVVNGSNASLSSALVGTPLQASVVVASSSTTTIPTGTADFNLYSGTSCSGSVTAQTGVALVNGKAQSATTTLAAGGLSYMVHYSGDTNFTPVNSACIPVTATLYSPTINTALSQTSVTAGSSVYNTASLVNASSTAGGSVTYKAYTNNACTDGAMNAGVKTVTNASVPNSDSLQFNNAGTFYFQAVYSGDVNNAPATSTCTTLTVTGTQAAPSVTIGLSNTNVQVGSSVYASSTLWNETSNAAGTVKYKVYSNNSCTTDMRDAGTVTVTNGIAPNSNSLQFNSAGTFYFQAVYSGDANNAAATSSCASVPLTVTTNSPTPGTYTISGTVYNDANKNDKQDNGEAGLSGWHVWLHKAATSSNSWWGWWGNNGKHDGYNDPIVATATTDANGNYSFGNLAAGTYFLEEEEKTGWNQTSSDTQVVLSANKTSADVDFSNVQKNGNGQGNGNGNNGNNGNGNGHDKDDDWHDNGNHNGWFNFNTNIGGWLHFGNKK
ncbi:MAG TPA: SpaA isopeptide-forming pilin-related protein [Candidatus Paceibacterota bacterium]|nr:SpaA isopeptide-forming pilin-related protein [Candidatus Paceibacterota bacterium]